MALMRTQQPSIGIRPGARPRILLVSVTPFHSSRVWPLSMAVSIQGMRLPARGAPKLAMGNDGWRRVSTTLRSRSRMAAAGLSSSCSAFSPTSRIWLTSSRMFFAPAPEAAW